MHSADGLSQSVKKPAAVGQGGRLTTSTYCLSPEETRLVKLARSQFERRGGWVRVFPTADSWCRYSQYLGGETCVIYTDHVCISIAPSCITDPLSGIPTSPIPSLTSSHLVVQHNYNHLLHTQLFPDVAKTNTATKGASNQKAASNSVVAAVGQRHNRYERQLDRGHRNSLDPAKSSHSKSQGEQYKQQVCDMLRNGKVLT